MTNQPAADREPARLLSQQPRIQLVPGQQEQEAQSDIGQQLNIGGLGQAEHMRPDQDAAEQEDDHLRNARAGQDGRQERRERSHQPHGYQVNQPLVKVHHGRLPGGYLVIGHVSTSGGCELMINHVPEMAVVLSRCLAHRTRPGHGQRPLTLVGRSGWHVPSIVRRRAGLAGR